MSICEMISYLFIGREEDYLAWSAEEQFYA